jgi:hypothetical protein
MDRRTDGLTDTCPKRRSWRAVGNNFPKEREQRVVSIQGKEYKLQGIWRNTDQKNINPLTPNYLQRRRAVSLLGGNFAVGCGPATDYP